MADALDQSLNDQDGLYTVMRRRIDKDGLEVSKPHIVSAIRAELLAQKGSDIIRRLARHVEIRVVTSNTMDAGIALNAWDMYDDCPPKSFPANSRRSCG